MQQAYVDINGVPTRVITYGCWIEESVPEDAPPDIVVCIPGNPGVTEFYIDFLQTLHEQLGFPVWIIGHAGHESPPKDSVRKMPPLKGNGQLYDLEGQIKHKYEFVSRYVPDNARIHFIGHSIGSYIILKLLTDLTIGQRAVASYFLFPTIEHMRDTPNGKFLNRFVRYIIPIILFFAWIFSLLPSFLQTILVRVYVTYYSVAPHHLKTIRNFIKPETLAQVFHMALDEMGQVLERDSSTIMLHKDRVKLYYGASDRWAPVRFCDGLKRDVPEIEAEVCRRNFEHAFVLQHSKEVALMVADWILERTNTRKY